MPIRFDIWNGITLCCKCHHNLHKTIGGSGIKTWYLKKDNLDVQKEYGNFDVILIDEAHNYVPQVGIIGSKGPLKKFVNEGRNIGLSIAVTTQQPSGLDSSIRRNADILMIHSITMKSDIDVTEGMLNTAVPSDFEVNKRTINANVFERMVRGLQIGYAIISCSNANRVFLSKIRPRVSAHGGTEY
jgi:hypothetical protein